MVERVHVSRQNRYSDFDFRFTPNLNTGDISIQTDNDAIKQSIINILTTNQGERPFLPSFGSDLLSYPLFENFNSVTRETLRQNITFAIENWEPRVVVNSINFEDFPDTHRLKIRIQYTILSPSERDAEVEFFVNRVR